MPASATDCIRIAFGGRIAAFVSLSQDEQQNVMFHGPLPDSIRRMVTTYIGSSQRGQCLDGICNCSVVTASVIVTIPQVHPRARPPRLRRQIGL